MKRIKDLIYYMFYRVFKFYKYWDWDFDCGWHFGWNRCRPPYMTRNVLGFSISFFVLSIIIFVLHYLFDKQLTYTGLVIIMSIVMLIVVCITSVLIGDEEKKYKELAKKYKTEKKAKLKGWLIFAFIIGTFILYIVSLLTCGYSGY